MNSGAVYGCLVSGFWCQGVEALNHENLYETTYIRDQSKVYLTAEFAENAEKENF
jgi:hypothetical protein